MKTNKTSYRSNHFGRAVLFSLFLMQFSGVASADISTNGAYNYQNTFNQNVVLPIKTQRGDGEDPFGAKTHSGEVQNINIINVYGNSDGNRLRTGFVGNSAGTGVSNTCVTMDKIRMYWGYCETLSMVAAYSNSGNVSGNSYSVNDFRYLNDGERDQAFDYVTHKTNANDKLHVSDSNLVAGLSTDGNVISNVLSLSNSEATLLKVYGGYSVNSSADKNIVNVLNCSGEKWKPSKVPNGSMPNTMIGGLGKTGASSNTVNVFDSEPGFNSEVTIIGGQAAQGNVDNNTINLKGIELNQEFRNTQDLNKSEAYYQNTIIGGYLNGDGMDSASTVCGNTINVLPEGENGIFDSGLYVAKINGDIYGGLARTGNSVEISQNIVNLQGTYQDKYLANAYNIYGGAYKNDNRNNNENIVKTNGGNVVKAIADGATITVANNQVNLDTVEVFNNVYGGYFFSENVPESASVKVDSNQVTLNSAKVGGTVYGGYSSAGKVSNNKIRLTSGTYNGTFYAGYSEGGSADKVIGNSITVDDRNSTTPVDLSAAKLWGSNYVGHNNNILNLSNWSKIDAANAVIDTVGHMNVIVLDGINATWNQPSLHINSLVINENSDPGEAETTISVQGIKIKSVDTPLQPGDTSKLITTDKITVDMDKATFTKQILKNVAVGTAQILDELEVELDENGKDILLKIPEKAEVQANPQTKAVAEARAAGMAFVQHGNDLIQSTFQGLGKGKQENKSDTFTFASLFGTESKYTTGSSVTVNGWNYLVGVGKNFASQNSKTSVGIFFEKGIGKYRAYYDGPRGDGSADYEGLGMLLKKENHDGWYGEFGLRGGKLDNNLKRGIITSGGEFVSCDMRSRYYGVHFGLGKKIDLGVNSLDIYANYVLTHHQGDSIDLDGDTYHIDKTNSHRTRLGARYNTAKGKNLNAYYGLAYEYEFDGRAKSRVLSYDLGTPSLRGGSIIGEIGLKYEADKKWNFDVGISGFAGKRKGGSFNTQVNYKF